MPPRKPPVVTADVPGTPEARASLPEQDMGFNPWPMLADLDVLRGEVEEGSHDSHLHLLLHCARSQELAAIVPTLTARLAALGA